MYRERERERERKYQVPPGPDRPEGAGRPAAAWYFVYIVYVYILIYFARSGSIWGMMLNKNHIRSLVETVVLLGKACFDVEYKTIIDN